MMSGQAQAAVAGTPQTADDSAGGLIEADDLPDGLVIADHAGRVTVFNRAAGRLTGIVPGHALGQDVRHILPLQDTDGRNWWAHIRPYHGLSTRTRHPERSLYLPCGTELLITLGYVRDPRGEARGGWHRDPGAVRRIVINIRGAQQRARIERTRADLVSTVAHELRSPLTSVKGFTATLLAKWPRFTDDQKKVMLETVNADADRVTRLITELLDVSRIESGRLEVHRQLVDVTERADRIIAGRVAAGDSPGRFRLEVRGDLPETWLDPDKVDQILGNLIENALRHGAGTVTTMVSRCAPQVPLESRYRSGTRARASRPSSRPGVPAVLAREAPRRCGPRPVHRQGTSRGARRHHRRAPGAGRRGGVPIYDARRHA